MSGRVPLLAGIGVLSFFAGITGIRLAYSLTYILVALIILAWGWTRLIARRLVIERQSPSGFFTVGEPFRERFVVRNRSLFWVPWCEVHDGSGIDGYSAGRACALSAGDTVSWTARGVFTRRGRARFGPLTARVGDPFGLFARTLTLPGTTEVVVYPALHPMADLGPLWSGTGSGDMRRGRAVDVPPEVATVREYDSADGMSRIHWASTARHGRLMSRTFDTRQSADILLVLDLNRGVHAGRSPESTLEYAVSLAASLVHAGIRRGQAVGLVTNDLHCTAFGAGRGETHRMRLLDFLATTDDTGHTPIAEVIGRHGEGWRGRGGMVVITPDRSPEWVEALVDASSRGQRHLAILLEPASFGDPGPPVRIPPAWRLALDWRVVRRGDVLGSGERARAAGG
ncbi:MAG: DUF58 domain-containing protein [Candidatus Dormibacteria bacterium]